MISMISMICMISWYYTTGKSVCQEKKRPRNENSAIFHKYFSVSAEHTQHHYPRGYLRIGAGMLRRRGYAHYIRPRFKLQRLRDHQCIVTALNEHDIIRRIGGCIDRCFGSRFTRCIVGRFGGRFYRCVDRCIGGRFGDYSAVRLFNGKGQRRVLTDRGDRDRVKSAFLRVQVKGDRTVLRVTL